MGFIRSKFSILTNGWGTNHQLLYSYVSPWKGIIQTLPSFPPFIKLLVRSGTKIDFWNDRPSPSQTYLPASLLHPFNKKLSRPSFFLPSDNWNFHFRRDLMEEEISEISSLLSLLNNVSLQPGLVYTRIWSLSSSGSLLGPIFLSRFKLF